MMTSAQVIETSVTNNSSFQNYSHPDDHTILYHAIQNTANQNLVSIVSMALYKIVVQHFLVVCHGYPTCRLVFSWYTGKIQVTRGIFHIIIWLQ